MLALASLDLVVLSANLAAASEALIEFLSMSALEETVGFLMSPPWPPETSALAFLRISGVALLISFHLCLAGLGLAMAALVGLVEDCSLLGVGTWRWLRLGGSSRTGEF